MSFDARGLAIADARDVATAVTAPGDHDVIYYHLSCLSMPLSCLWLSATSPALIRKEMGRAYHADARQGWLANIGVVEAKAHDPAIILDALRFDPVSTQGLPHGH